MTRASLPRPGISCGISMRDFQVLRRLAIPSEDGEARAVRKGSNSNYFVTGTGPAFHQHDLHIQKSSIGVLSHFGLIDEAGRITVAGHDYLRSFLLHPLDLDADGRRETAETALRGLRMETMGVIAGDMIQIGRIFESTDARWLVHCEPKLDPVAYALRRAEEILIGTLDADLTPAAIGPRGPGE